MIDFIYLGVSPSSCAIACAHNLNHHIYSSPWISSTSPLAFWTPQTKTEPGQPGFRFCTPNALPRLFSCSPPTAHSNSVSTPLPVLPLHVASEIFDGRAILSTRARYPSFCGQNPRCRSILCSWHPTTTTTASSSPHRPSK